MKSYGVRMKYDRTSKMIQIVPLWVNLLLLLLVICFLFEKAILMKHLRTEGNDQIIGYYQRNVATFDSWKNSLYVKRMLFAAHSWSDDKQLDRNNREKENYHPYGIEFKKNIRILLEYTYNLRTHTFVCC